MCGNLLVILLGKRYWQPRFGCRSIVFHVPLLCLVQCAYIDFAIGIMLHHFFIWKLCLTSIYSLLSLVLLICCHNDRTDVSKHYWYMYLLYGFCRTVCFGSSVNLNKCQKTVYVAILHCLKVPTTNARETVDLRIAPHISALIVHGVKETFSNAPYADRFSK